MATASRSDPAGVAALVLGLVERRAPTLGRGRLVCIDGPAGSGKTTLARAVADLRPDACVLHMDDLYDGWPGLAAGVAQLGDLLADLSVGMPGGYRRYDWHAGRYAETVTVRPAPLVVAEGVGAGAVGHAALTGLLVWVAAPDEVRVRRGLERDGAESAGPWRRWLVTEAAHFAADGTEARADVAVDGLGLARPVVRDPA